MLSNRKLAHPFLWVALIASLAVATLCALCVWGVVWHRGVPVDPGWTAVPRGGSWLIAEVSPTGPAFEKLRAGDQILSINSDSEAARFAPDRKLAEALGPYSIDVFRSGRVQHFVLPVWPVPQRIWTLVTYLCLALVNLALAVWIAVARPEYAPARIAFFLFLGTAATFAAGTLDSGFWPPLHGFLLGLVLVVGAAVWHPLEWATVYDFALRFPEPVPQPRLLRAARVVFYCIALIVFIFGMLPIVAQVLSLASRSSLLPSWFPLARVDVVRPLVGDAFSAAALLAAPVILARNYRHLPDAMSRRRLRWAALGIALAIAPMACGVALRFLLQLSGRTNASESVDTFLDTFASFALVLAPITLTYAIARHRVLGIRLVVRRGVQYLLARNVLRLILYSPLIAIVIDVSLHPHEGLAEFLLHKAWWFYLALIVSASFSLRYRSRLQFWVDRKFFRAAYEEQAILTDLIERLQICETSSDVARVVSRQIEETLKPSVVCVLFKNKSVGRFTVAYPFDSPLALHFRGVLNEHLQDAIESDRVSRPFPKTLSGSESDGSLTAEELRKTVLTAITTPGGELLGVLVLGEKKSEEKYSSRDRKLLQAVATQIALVLEMVVLKEQVKEEGRVRVEVLARLEQEHIQLLLECPSCGRCYNSPVTQCEEDHSPLGFTLPIERIIDHKYRLDRRIGVGGMGAVYEASDLRLQRTVAVKIMTGRLFGNSSAFRRFEREARLAARLQHPAIVSIYDFGSLRGEGAYLVMQLIPGRSWRAEMQAAGQIRPARAAVWIDQLCDAIALAHSSGVIHRDLKPENLLVWVDGSGLEKITVLDFGLAKLRNMPMPSHSTLTTEDTVVGTQAYMSPEQRRGEPVDDRSDVYSLAVIIVELLTNNKPPNAGASRRWLRSVLRWPTPGAICTQVTNLLTRCMGDAPSQRPAVQTLQREVVPLLRECPLLLATKAAGASSSETVARPLS